MSARAAQRRKSPANNVVFLTRNLADAIQPQEAIMSEPRDIQYWTNKPMAEKPDWLVSLIVGEIEPNSTFLINTPRGHSRVHVGNVVVLRQGHAWTRPLTEVQALLDDLDAEDEPAPVAIGPGKKLDKSMAPPLPKKAPAEDDQRVYREPLGSMPSIEWFLRQEKSYRDQIIPPDIRARVSVEAGVTLGWREIVGAGGEMVGIDHFGASAAGPVLMEQFGFTPDRVVAAAHAALEQAGVITGSKTGS